MFYDDGSLTQYLREMPYRHGRLLQADILRCGFLLSEVKVEMLWYNVFTFRDQFKIPVHHLERFMSLLRLAMEGRCSVKDCAIARS